MSAGDRKQWSALLAVAASAAVLLAGCGTDHAAASDSPEGNATPSSHKPKPKPRLQQAAEACYLAGRLQDNGKSISLDTIGEEDAGVGDEFEDVDCILTETNTPQYVIDHMNSTRALDGMQTDQWNGFKARWTYHPDDGVNITFIDERFHPAAKDSL